MPLADIDKIAFFSGDPIDKIVQQGEITIVNDGDTTASGSGDGSAFPRLVSSTTPNNYGRSCFVRARWSIDGGTTWQSLDTIIIYSYTITLTDIPFTSTPQPQLDSAISIGTTSDTIHFKTANGKHGNVSRTTAQPITSGYTPTSRTFLIQYTLYERR